MELISKKELLQRTGISYGQLYRWKRERLIPEEWFIKRSSFTGQETFFPAEQILPRVEAILQNKDRYSLGELSRMLSADIAPALVEDDALEQIEEIAPEVRTAAGNRSADGLALLDVALLVAVTEMINWFSVPTERQKKLAELVLSAAKGAVLDTVLTVFVAGGEFHAILHSAGASIVFDSTITVSRSVSIRETAETLKMKYRALFPALSDK